MPKIFRLNCFLLAKSAGLLYNTIHKAGAAAHVLKGDL